MRKYFLELFAIGLVDSEGRINTEHMTSDALMTAMKTMEELTQMKMDRLVLETTMEMILCMFESCDTEEFTEILGKLLGGKQTSKVTAHLEALEELLTEEEYSSFLAEYLGYLTDSDTRKMQDLVDGKSISFILNDSMNYDSLSEHDPNDFWSLLLHTGYLTLDWDKSNNKELRINTVSNNDVFVRIPNLEIKNCFKDSIQRRFNKEIAPNSVADEIATALLNGDNSFAQTKLRAILMRFISLRDNATKAPLENYYHGYLNGLFTNCSENFFSEYHSNNEADNGYSDISFADTFSEKAVIIELKVGSLGSDLVSLSEKALSQIEEKNYAEPFLQNSMTQSIFAYGIAFSGKNCLVACKKLK